jgi:hypothetical protein
VAKETIFGWDSITMPNLALASIGNMYVSQPSFQQGINRLHPSPTPRTLRRRREVLSPGRAATAPTDATTSPIFWVLPLCVLYKSLRGL